MKASLLAPLAVLTMLAAPAFAAPTTPAPAAAASTAKPATHRAMHRKTTKKHHRATKPAAASGQVKSTAP
jgi:hypothetical protein